MRTRLAAAAIALVCLSLPGCGDDGQSADPLDLPLSYLPADASFVAVVSTDLDGDQAQSLSNILSDRVPEGKDLESYLREDLASGEPSISYDDEVAPVLGNPLVVAAINGPGPLALADTEDGGQFIGVGQVADAGAARNLLEKIGLRRSGEVGGADLYDEEEYGGLVALEGDVLVVGEPSAVRSAVEQRDRGGGFTFEQLDSALRKLPRDALVRAYADAEPVLDQRSARAFRALPWVDAIQSGGASLSFRGDDVTLDLVVSTDPEGLAETDLPLPSGAPALELPQRPDEIGSASANQSRLTSFLLRAARVGFPDSRFVKDVATLERELGIDFERDVLLQFNGPSVSSLKASGEFAARSEVRDPRRLAATMRRLAPDLGRLVQDLDALQTEGLSLLLLFAPDAPVSTGVLGAGFVRVERIRGQRDLYRISNLNRLPSRRFQEFPGPDEIVFGLVGDVFVVASSEERARAIASEPVASVEGLRGAGIAQGRVEALRRPEFDPGPGGSFTGSISVSRERLRATAQAELP